NKACSPQWRRTSRSSCLETGSAASRLRNGECRSFPGCPIHPGRCSGLNPAARSWCPCASNRNARLLSCAASTNSYPRSCSCKCSPSPCRGSPHCPNRARVAEGQRRVQVEMHHAEPPIDVQLRGCIPVDFGISGAAVEEIRPGGVIVVHKAGDGKVRERDETEYFLCNRIDTGRGNHLVREFCLATAVWVPCEWIEDTAW